MKNNIRQALEDKGLKISYVIEKTRLSKSYFYDVMNGVSVPSLLIARKIEEVLEVPLNELFPNSNLTGDKGEMIDV